MSRFFLTLLACLPLLLPAQKPAQPTAAELFQAVRKLNVLGSVLYVAAHPDDENQRFIAHMANERLFEVTYLSLTRGDGGQNLIGPELRERIGVLRTEELLAARSVDGGQQRFSRANDFGFSKNPEEALRIWGRDSILADVVWQFRQCQPDVVVNRFFHEKKFDTHGHHTASAMLSAEAFDRAGKADAFPEQLNLTEPWQPRRQFFNVSPSFFKSRDEFEKLDKSQLWSLDLGAYLPLKGKSVNELAAEARSMHRCQGMGQIGERGEAMDYFQFVKGERPAPGNDLFAGINTTWTRVPDGKAVGKILARVERQFRVDNPAASVPDLLRAVKLMKALPDGFWKRTKLGEIRAVICGCLGLFLEATASEQTVAPGDFFKLKLEAINRSAVAVELAGVSVLPRMFDTLFAQNLANNRDFIFPKNLQLPENVPFTAPYWLLNPWTWGQYSVPDQRLRGLPETPRAARVRWQMTVGGEPMEFETDVVFKKEEPARGEVYQPFEVLPPAFVELDEGAYFFPENSREVRVRVTANRENLKGWLRLNLPKNWSATPADTAVLIGRKGGSATFAFRVTASPPRPLKGELPVEKLGNQSFPQRTPPLGGGGGLPKLSATVEVGGQAVEQRMTPILYDHIPRQSVLLPSAVPAARLDVAVSAKNVGYIMGAGDDVPAALRQIGCRVTLLDLENLPSDLGQFEAIVVGIRAYNTRPALKFQQEKLLDFARAGGTVVVQYQVPDGLVLENPAPFPLKLSQKRVTDETAEMRFLLPDHPALNQPNRLTAKDFEGWIQELGLYFPSEWDKENFAAPLSCNDPGEAPLDGSLLVARLGRGWFVYTGLSFFRQLPQGVPGAMRVFANLLSLGGSGTKK